MAPRTTIFLVRHGARFDYANKEEWARRCSRHGHEACDPPLSALGHAQARETAAELVRRGARVDCILSSPYLRVLQTAQPLAHALGVPIRIDFALAEYKHEPGRIPSFGARVPFFPEADFPEVDEEYEPLLGECHADPSSGREPLLEYMRRMLLLAHELPRRHTGGAVACYSHAASVALVAALTGCGTLCEAGRFAPCGIWELASDDGGASWRILGRGDDNSAYTARNDPTTFPWGFEHDSSREASEAAWAQARLLGPTAAVAPCEVERRGPATRPEGSPKGTRAEGAALVAAYGLMWAAQAKGGAIVELLHGVAARRLAEAPQQDVAADAPLGALCRGYVSHHHEPTSNCLHAAGMLLSFWLFVQALVPPPLMARPRGRSYAGHLASSLTWAPPLYYLYAWAGHFFMQADIPAVFTYGMTLRGWACGELCSVWALFSGQTVAQPIELLAVAAIVALHLAVFPPSLSRWGGPGSERASCGAKAKAN